MHSGKPFRALLLVVLFTLAVPLAAAATTVYGAGANGQPSASFAPPHTNVALKEPDQALWPDQWTPSAQDLETLTSNFPTGTLAPERLSELPHPASLPANSLATDRAALVALYHATGGDNWTNNDNWLTDAPLGDWYGVTIGETPDGNVRVAGLSLADNGLDGEIPPELGNLTHLQSLDLSGNQLTGEIPPELSNPVNTRSPLYAHAAKGTSLESGNLANLVELSLNDNQLSGEIPWELDTLTNLEGLRLGNNGLTGCVSASLEDVPDNDLDGLGLPPCSVPAQTGSVATDRAALVDLYNNTGGANWTDNTNWLSNEPLGRWLGVITDSDGRVTDLYLDSNGLNGSIPASMGNLTELQALFLSGNSLTGCIPAGLRRVPVTDFDDLDLDFCTTVTRPPTPVGGATKIYWTDYATDKIYRSNLDGSQVEELVTFRRAGVEGIAVDVAAGKMYWTEVLSDKIGRANLDGSQVEYLVTSGLDTPVGIALDVAAGKMYWTDRLRGGRVLRANLDGSQVEALVTSGQRDPYGIFLDLAAGKVYWTTDDAIRRANLDGSQVETLLTSSRAGAPTEIALDVAAGKMYWTDFRGNSIRRSNLDGSQVETLITSGLRLPDGLELDVAAGKMYWTEIRGASVRRSNLDGSQVEDLVTSGLRRPTHLTLDLGAGTGTTGPSGSAAIDRQALVALYNATDGPNWSRNGNWLTSAPLDHWDGVLTDADGRVTDLFLDDNGLTGELPQELVRLTRLQLLYISGNSGLTGCIPADLQYIPENDFDELELVLCGEAPESAVDRAVLIALYNATDGLNWTDNTNWLSDSPVSRWYGVVTGGSGRVTDLFLDGNELTGEVPAELANLESLESLYLADNQLTGCIPAALRDVPYTDFDELDLPFCTATTPPTVGTTAKIYWSELGGGKIRRANPDGSQVEDVVTGLRVLQDFALDVAGAKLYWVEHSANKIQRANLDGSQVEDVVTGQRGALQRLTLDVAAGKVYWTYSGGGINRANLDGSQVENLIALGREVHPGEIALDVAAGKMYWLEYTEDQTGDKIQRANLDGSQVEVLVSDFAQDIALDVSAGKLYWSTLGKIQRANLDGSQVEDVATTPASSLALDVSAGKLYWSTFGKIQRANLDGSQVEDVVAVPAFDSIGGWEEIALDLSGPAAPPTSTAPCVEDLGTLTVAINRNGSWTSDCASSTKEGRYARFYTFTLSQEATVQIDLTSSRDTVLNLLEGAGRDGDVKANNDDVATGSTNSQIKETLEAGTYTIEATTFAEATTGDFTLTIALVTVEPPPPPPTPPPGNCVEDLGTLTATVTRNGSWATDCVSTGEPNTYARFYSFTLGQQTDVQIDLTSSVDTVLNLREGAGAGGQIIESNDDVVEGHTNSQIPRTLDPGAYTVEATTYAQGRTGGFTVTIAPEGTTPDECATDLGALTASVTETGSWDSDCPSTNQSGSYAHYYSFSLGRQTEVTIDLTSSRDTMMYLLRGPGRDGAVITSNDDVVTGNTNSQIVSTLAAGSYTIEATTYTGGQTGVFTLTITLRGADSCATTDLGTLTEDTQQTLILDTQCDSETRRGSHARFYTFDLSQETDVTITLALGAISTSPVDTYLYLREGQARSGPHIAENDNHQGSQIKSQIQSSLDAGRTYTIEATTKGPGQTAILNLSIALGDAPPVTDACVQAITDNGTVSGEWAAGCESETRSGSHARFYTITLAQESEVTITLESSIDTYLYLRAGEAQSGATVDDGENDDHDNAGLSRTTDSQIVADLGTGTYTIEATTYDLGETGSFTLTIEGLGATQTDDECLEDITPTAGQATTSLTKRWTIDCTSANQSGKYARFYTFTPTQGGEVAIELESTDTQTYLYLLQGAGRDGTVIDSNSDVGRDNVIPRITADLQAGTAYTVEVIARDLDPSVMGSFNLSITWPDIRNIGRHCGTGLGTLTGTTTRAGSWDSSCDSTARKGSYARYYTFNLEEEQTGATIYLTSKDQDTYLVLRRGWAIDGEIIAENDDAADYNRNSRIAWTLDAGRYTVEATTYAGSATGEFLVVIAGAGVTLRAEPLLPRWLLEQACPAVPLGTLRALNNYRAGIWDDAYSLKDCISANESAGYSQLYTFTLSSPASVNIKLSSDDVPQTVIYLMHGDSNDPRDPEERRIAAHRGRGDDPAIVDVTLDPGTYTVDAVSGGRRYTGKFRLTVIQVPSDGTRLEQPPGSDFYDWRALVALYGQTGGNWTNNLNWLTDAPLDQWYGVDTDSAGRVIALDLANNGLEGEIPSELGGLAQLIDLRLQQNRLQGTIPPNLGALWRYGSLEVAHLHQHNLEGCIPIGLEVPLAVAWAEVLNAKLKDPDLNELPVDTNRRLIDFLAAVAGGSVAERLAKNLLWPTQGLGLPPCPPSAQGPTSVDPDLQDTDTDRDALVALYRDTDGANWRDNDDWITNPDLDDWQGVDTQKFDGVTRVTRLDLPNNNLIGEIPEELGNLRYLEHLNLSNAHRSSINQLSGSIPKELGNLTILETLSLRNNNLRGEIPATLGHLQGGCNVSFVGFICRVRDDHYVDLNLQNNNLSGEIPAELGNIGYLRHMTTKPGNDGLTGCVVPSAMFDFLKLGSSQLLSSVISLGTGKASDAVKAILKRDLLDAVPLIGGYLDDLLEESLGEVVEWFDNFLSGILTEPLERLLGLGNIEDVACD